jgi:hypothetical protein
VKTNGKDRLRRWWIYLDGLGEVVWGHDAAIKPHEPAPDHERVKVQEVLETRSHQD